MDEQTRAEITRLQRAQARAMERMAQDVRVGRSPAREDMARHTRYEGLIVALAS